MLTEAQIQQDPKPKRRIGRARFLLEFIVAGLFIKVGTSGYGVVPTLVIGIGLFLAIWASVRRLRDIQRSEWWATVMVMPLPLGFFLGFTGFHGTIDAYMAPLVIVFMVIYLLYVGVLLFWPSAFPASAEAAAMTEKKPSTEIENREKETTTGTSVSDIEDRAFAQAASELDTNQRDAGVWARAFSDAEGDENRAKALYIRYRAKRITK